MPVVGVVPLVRARAYLTRTAPPRRRRPTRRGRGWPLSATQPPPISTSSSRSSRSPTSFWRARPAELEGADLVVLPGSKHVVGDLRWLRETGLERCRGRACSRGRRGCSGSAAACRCSARRSRIPPGSTAVGGASACSRWTTIFSAEKLRPADDSAVRPAGAAPWGDLSGRAVSRDTRSGTGVSGSVGQRPRCDLPDGRGCAMRSGARDRPARLLRAAGARGGVTRRAPARSLDAALDRLADEVERHLDSIGRAARARWGWMSGREPSVLRLTRRAAAAAARSARSSLSTRARKGQVDGGVRRRPARRSRAAGAFA